MQSTQSRRRFLATVSAAGAACLVGARKSLAEEAPPEITRLRLIKSRSICWAPQYIAEELLRSEGFNEITFFELPGGPASTPISAGEADLSMNFVGPNIVQMDAGDPLVHLAGLHIGCFEVFAGEGVKKMSDLKGKTAA